MKHKGIMKKAFGILVFALLIMGMCTVPANASTSAKQKAYKAYANFLSKKYISTGDWANYEQVRTSDVKFTTYDIDKNGIPELLVYYPLGATMCEYHKIYTYSHGKVKQLNASFDPCVIKRGVIYSAEAGCGAVDEYYYSYVKGKLKCVCSAEYYDDADYAGYDNIRGTAKDKYGNYQYYTAIKVNGKNTSLKAYNKKVKALRKNRIKVKYKKNTKANRTKYLVKK